MYKIANNIYRKARIGDATIQWFSNHLQNTDYSSIIYRVVLGTTTVLFAIGVVSIVLFNADSVYAEKLITASILLLMLLLNRFLSSNQ
mgnify:CR=1 FL=1